MSEEGKVNEEGQESPEEVQTQESGEEELSPDELMAQQFGEMAAGEESEVDPDTLMAQQFAAQEYGGQDDSTERSKFSLLLDIPLEITVEVGSTEIKIEEVLKLNPNSIIELDRYINEPVDLKVNGKVIAKGELYTVKENFGIKITHIITPEDRLKILEG